MFENLDPLTLPDDIDLFKLNFDKYPLLKEAEDYVLEATLEKGDCIFAPSLYWMQFETEGDMSMMLSFEYQPSSKYVDLLFQAIQEGLHKD